MSRTLPPFVLPGQDRVRVTSRTVRRMARYTVPSPTMVEARCGGMGNLGELSPHHAQDAAGFVALMQRLKELSGLTYRELEERAAQNGELLARSTLAGALQRTSLPRPDVLAAFVRACGDGQRASAWLDARSRIAAEASAASPTTTGSPSRFEPQPQTVAAAKPGPPKAKARKAVRVAGLLVPLLALSIGGLLFDRSDHRETPHAPVVEASATASRASADGWVTIRPARSPQLCLTDGRARNGAYASAVAVQRTCAQAAVPRTYLEPAGEGLYRIQWHHPQEGKGCLTVMSSGPVKGMLEPRNNCAQATLFRVEAASADNDGFRLRPANATTCIGIAGNDTTAGAEAVEEPCTAGVDQRFLIRAD